MALSDLQSVVQFIFLGKGGGGGGGSTIGSYFILKVGWDLSYFTLSVFCFQ